MPIPDSAALYPGYEMKPPRHGLKNLEGPMWHYTSTQSQQAETMMPKALWNSAVIAESDKCEVVEGNQYFPASAVKREHLQPSDTHTVCPWKGTASYYNVVVEGEVNPDAAWYYPEPKEAAKNIKHHVAFWKGVKVEI